VAKPTKRRSKTEAAAAKSAGTPRERAKPSKPGRKSEYVERAKAWKPAQSEDQRRRADKRWYCRPDKPHEAVHAVVNSLLAGKDREELALWRLLFLDRKLEGAAARRADAYRPGMRARFNVIRNASEVLHARIGRQLARPWIVTVAGNWKTQRKAKAMGRYLEGDWERLGADALRRDALLDALVFGTGAIKVFEEQGRVAWSRVWRGDLLTHPREEAAGCVRTLYQIAFADREVLAETWDESRAEIENLDPLDRSLLSYDGADDTDDLVMVIEAWHLPSGIDDNGELRGGRRVVVVDGHTLEDAPWKRKGFPIAMLHATKDPGRMWGIGYPERMAGLQSEQNSMAELASDVVRKMTPKYVFPNGQKLTVDTSTNEIEVWETDGDGQSVPFVLAADNTIMAVQQASAMQRSEMYRIEGVSESSAEGSSPDNLDSGKAKLVHRDIESERHVILAQNNEAFTVELAKLHIAQTEEIAASDDNEQLVAHSGKSSLIELRWTDVSIGDDPYHVRVYPVSALSSSPQGKLAQLREMMEMQMISGPEARELFEFPDLERSNDLAFAGRELARSLIESALDGNRTAATRVCDNVHLVDQGWKEHALAMLQGASEDDLVELRDLLGAAQSLLDQQAAQAAAAQPAAPMPPPMPAAPSPMPGGAPALQVVPP
jgi:hypothetical protein